MVNERGGRAEGTCPKGVGPSGFVLCKWDNQSARLNGASWAEASKVVVMWLWSHHAVLRAASWLVRRLLRLLGFAGGDIAVLRVGELGPGNGGKGQSEWGFDRLELFKQGVCVKFKLRLRAHWAIRPRILLVLALEGVCGREEHHGRGHVHVVCVKLEQWKSFMERTGAKQDKVENKPRLFPATGVCMKWWAMRSDVDKLWSDWLVLCWCRHGFNVLHTEDEL